MIRIDFGFNITSHYPSYIKSNFMKNILPALISLILVSGCFGLQDRVSANHSSISRTEGVILLDELPFTGVLYDLYPNGSQKFEQEFSEGKKHGMETLWYPNSNLRSMSEFSHGILNGSQREWYQDGTPAREMQFVDGKQSGEQIGWKENGDLRFKYIYKNGKRYGFMGSALCQAPE